MFKVYEIRNTLNGHRYIGMTRNELSRRWSQHLYQLRSGKKTKLYDAMRSYGIDNFQMDLLAEYDTHQECCAKEIELIVNSDYNIARGGQGGFNITNTEAWKAKLRKARIGRKPALGMKHSEETKKLCGEYSRKRHERSRSNAP
jgi:group I intron endonuclease